MSLCKYLGLPMIACFLAAPSALASEISYFPGYTVYAVDFGAFSAGITTPFSETVGDLTITYIAPNDPSAFRTVDSTSLPVTPSLSPWLLGREGSSTLEVTLSRPVYGAAVEYLTLGPGPIQMDFMSGGLGGSIIRTRSESAPAGFIGFVPVCICPNDFDAVRLSHLTDPSFAIGRILLAESVAVPEPTALALLAVGLAMLVAIK